MAIRRGQSEPTKRLDSHGVRRRRTMGHRTKHSIKMKRHADNTKGPTSAVGEIITENKVTRRKILRFGRMEENSRNVYSVEPCVCGLWTICKCG